MRILIAEDDSVSRHLLESILQKWGYEVTSTSDGRTALEILTSEGAPKLAILDWMMPETDGINVCRAVRAIPTAEPPYLVLLTTKANPENIVEGLESGANDYVTKPFDRFELRARLQVGCRNLELQTALSSRVRELEEALSRVKQLQQLLPICCYCKKIRDDQNYWQQIDSYLSLHTDARFSHGICPDCMEQAVRDAT